MKGYLEYWMLFVVDTVRIGESKTLKRNRSEKESETGVPRLPHTLHRQDALLCMDISP
jgi:hypothetical protein